MASCATPPLLPDYTGANPTELRHLPRPTNILVTLQVRDARPVRDLALVEALRDRLDSGLRARGFRLTDDGTCLEVSIQHLYRDQKQGFWSSSESSELILRCRVGDRSGRVRFDERIIGRSGVLKREAQTQSRLRAFEDALFQLLNDPALMRALGENHSMGGSP